MGKKERDFCPFLFSSAVYGSPYSPPSSIPSPPSSPPYYSSTKSSSHYYCSSPSITSPFVYPSSIHPLSPATAASSPADFGNLSQQYVEQRSSAICNEEIIVDGVFGANMIKFHQFKRGLEEASKFIPTVTQLVNSKYETSNLFANGPKEETPLMAVKDGKVERSISPDDGPMDWEKNNQGDSDSEQGSSNKKPAIYGDKSDEELFDMVLLWPGLKSATEWCYGTRMREDSTPQQNDQSNGSAGGKARAIKPVRKKEIMDLGSLLIPCAQAVSGNDFRTANELLKQIRQHSSPTGNGPQRLAHYFANGLEARSVGSGAGLPNLYMNLASKRTTVADKLNAYKTHHSCCPFEKLSIFFATKMILHAAEKSKTLHIIDFGVLYGFQWPILIQRLSMRPGGPPKLRITGIELPQPGFRPTERIKESGRRLASYCERFQVPFDYNPIATQNWESIPIEDLKIRTDEVLAVNCMGRFKNLLDETVELDCPRNAVLDLIRKIKPNIFVHSIINGSYNAPFFLTRFKEALFHFSSMFDMLDSTLPREDEGRMILENEMYGREAINVVACEGVERVERPETYKQWQVRNTRAGFRQLPLDQETMEKLRGNLKSYNKESLLYTLFWSFINKDGNEIRYSIKCFSAAHLMED